MSRTRPRVAGAAPTGGDERLFVLSYLSLRRLVGGIGLGLPPVLLVGEGLLEGRWSPLDSLSAYYYSSQRNVFVGSLCALGAFLVCYRYKDHDNLLSTAAGLAAVVVAVLPTTHAGGDRTGGEVLVGVLHYLAAALFFGLLATFCLAVFTRTGGAPTRRKQLRNRLYRTCGTLIIVALVLAAAGQAAHALFDGWPPAGLHPLFWLETVAVWAYGVAWLVKGELPVLRDEPGATPAAAAGRARTPGAARRSGGPTPRSPRR